MAEHIDGNRLNTDLRYRFEYLSKFLDFDSDDIAMLNTFAPIVFPLIPGLSETVYRKLFSFDITKHHFLQTKHCNVTLDSVHMEVQRDMLSLYLKRILTQDDWNDSFLQYLSQVGHMHTNQSGSRSINVDYVHVNALLSYLQHLLIDVLYGAETMDERTKRGVLMAVNKFFCIQNDFFALHYLLPLREQQQQQQAEKTSTCCGFFSRAD